MCLSLLHGGPAVVELGRIASPAHPKGTAYTVDLRRGVQLSPRGFAREAGPCYTAPATSSTRVSKPGVLRQIVSYDEVGHICQTLARQVIETRLR